MNAPDPKLVRIPVDYKVAAGYCFLVAFAYQFGYWRPFGIPIFQFASFSDVVRFAIWPVVLTIGGSVVWGWVQYRAAPDEKALSEKEWLWIRRIGFVVVSAVWIVATVRDWPVFWLLFGIFAAYSCWLFARRYFVLDGVPTELHGGALFILASAPMWAWGIGANQAHEILAGGRITHAAFPHETYLKLNIDDGEELRFLGRMDSVTLLWMPKQHRVLVVGNSDAGGMQLDSAEGRDARAVR